MTGAVAIVPARGGSKRIPRKNVRAFAGKPMIAWPLAAATEAGCFERIVVTTDDADIAATARVHGAETPFVRPAHLADDHTATQPVIAHAIDALGLGGDVPVCCIYPTAPFLRAGDLLRGLDRLGAGDATFVLPIAPYPFPIQRAVRRGADGALAMFDPDAFAARSQDLEEAWHDAGQFYWATAATWRTGTPIFAAGAVGLDLPADRVQDIDTPGDWRRAELMHAAMQDAECHGA
ncbi:pseudaminic acid cytidylyltransferase [uncultured Sulfitobacter sp.]|uniref:pseudaminic acid cytidylyltransferase n=1 Tax=uncultured Sulfitobacter sp. TaxID=191468 RepID=UPI002609615F|nr:pseudaminic acid cytidylyltransferase [uncultured Sulfitobacter sp.]